MTLQSKKNFLVNVAFFVVLTTIFYLLVKCTLKWLMPFVIAIIVSALLQRPINTVSRRTKLNRRLCSVLIMSIVFFVLGCLIFLLGYRITNEITSFFSELASSIDKELELNSNLSQFDAFLNILPPSISETVSQISETISSDLVNVVKSLAISISTNLTSALANIPRLLVSFIITIVSSFFFCMDYDKIKTFIGSCLPQKYHSIVVETKKYTINAISKMGKSYVIIIFVTFIELSIGMLIVGISFPFIIAAIIAIIDILPVLGTGTILIPWSIISFLTNDWITGVKILIIYAVITIIRNIIEPRIVGNQIGLHPIITLVAMYSGLQIFGVLGIFLFPMLILILKYLKRAGFINLENTVSLGG